MNTNFTAKLLGSTFLLVAAMSTAEAAHLSPEQSLSRAQTASSVMRIPGNTGFTLAHTQKVAGESFLYVFNKGDQGFIVTSADDRMPALLGYSDNGSFNASEASPELKWWLGQYASQAEGVMKSEAKMMIKAQAPRAPKANVPELLTTRWNQDYPYNLDCPSDQGGQCVTGCVATAMAQVIKYYGYPVKGNGNASYTWNEKTLSFDYSNANFNYQNMLDEYPRNGANYSQVQKEAVAKLMYACGVGVKMNYSTDSSGALDIYIASALKEYFNYDKSIQYLQRDCFTDEDWNDIVYAELKAGRPVIYGGQSEGGGHEFICDGYKDGYFHINWGWGGHGNGWFLLSSLDPGSQGIGGGIGGFDYDQSIICGIQPNAGNAGISYPLIATGGLEAYGIGSYRGELALSLGFTSGGVWNYSPEEINTSFYMKAVSETGEEYVSSKGYDVLFGGASDQGISGFTRLYLYLPAAPEGSYKAYVEYMGPQGELMPLMVPVSEPTYLNMTVDADGNVSFSDGEPGEKASIVVTEFSPESAIVSGEITRLNMTIQNTGNVSYSGLIYMCTYNKDDEEPVDGLKISNIGIGAGKVFRGCIDYTYDLPDGEYDVMFYDMYDEPCSDVFHIVIGVPEVEVSSIKLDITEKTLTEGESFTITATVDPENATDKSVTWTSSDDAVATVAEGIVTAVSPGTAIITASTANGKSATCTVTVEKKFIYATSISLDKTSIEAEVGETVMLVATVLPDDVTEKTVAWSSTDETVATVDQEGKVTILAMGTATIIAATTDGSDLQAECLISGVAGVESQLMETEKVDVYTLDGLLLRKNADATYVSNLAKGTYILRTPAQYLKLVK